VFFRKRLNLQIKMWWYCPPPAVRDLIEKEFGRAGIPGEGTGVNYEASIEDLDKLDHRLMVLENLADTADEISSENLEHFTKTVENLLYRLKHIRERQ